MQTKITYDIPPQEENNNGTQAHQNNSNMVWCPICMFTSMVILSLSQESWTCENKTQGNEKVMI